MIDDVMENIVLSLFISGSLIPNNCIMALCNILSQDCVQTYTEQHSQPIITPEEESHLSMPSFDF